MHATPSWPDRPETSPTRPSPQSTPTAVTSSDPDVVIVPSAPHRPLLEEASVVVTHAGHGTTLKALASGVPMVCVPMGRDQADTAVRVVHAGAGVRLSPKSSAAQIAAAVTTVLDQTRFAAAAATMARTIAHEQSSVDVVAEIESLTQRSVGQAINRL
ncbi:MAG: hypothetical protein OEQ47_16065 [Acidimicrobiia bacterium]|nr:hypothetical protein [Acidimicrobiia bacterium]